jgi:hypothetical protein
LPAQGGAVTKTQVANAGLITDTDRTLPKQQKREWPVRAAPD